MVSCGMADKHPPLLRTQVEIAAACGVAERKIAAAFGVARTTVQRWVKIGETEKQLARTQAYKLAHPERTREYNRKADAKRDNVARTQQWRKNNPGKAKANDRRQYRKQYKANPGYFADKARARQVNMAQWPCSEIEKLMIKYRYEDARRLTKETGIEYHVDHIIPLAKGGPHLPWNLQVITKDENLSKGAKIWFR